MSEAELDLKTALISKILGRLLDSTRAGSATDEDWTAACAACEAAKEEDAEIRAALDGRDPDALAVLIEQWNAGDRLLPEQDRAVLKRAMKAYKKRIKLARLDAESTIGGGALSGGRESSIVGVRPPEQYPAEVWDELIRQGRLIRGEAGVIELPR